MKAMNDYACSCENYDKTSKAVFAALAYSLAVRLTGEEDHDGALAILRDEWRTLHEQGIVPQRPPNSPICVKPNEALTNGDPK